MSKDESRKTATMHVTLKAAIETNHTDHTDKTERYTIFVIPLIIRKKLSRVRLLFTVTRFSVVRFVKFISSDLLYHEFLAVIMNV